MAEMLFFSFPNKIVHVADGRDSAVPQEIDHDSSAPSFKFSRALKVSGV
jgi:hypothetical protein